MARGWESKAVESQIEALEDRSRRREPIPDPAQTAARAERESLLLSRERILREIAETQHPRRREQLGAALAYLEQKLNVI